MCSQVFDGVYTFSFAAVPGADDGICAAWGAREQNPVVTQFTDRSRGEEAPAASLIDTGELHCISLHKEGEGYLARLWNHGTGPRPVSVRFRGRQIRDFRFCDALGRPAESAGDAVPPGSVVTVYFTAD
jgi:hypothetical protein